MCFNALRGLRAFARTGCQLSLSHPLGSGIRDKDEVLHQAGAPAHPGENFEAGFELMKARVAPQGIEERAARAQMPAAPP